MDDQDGTMANLPTRPMRVKVLYTFDHESKTNCLARIPDVLQIPAVIIDDNNQVGVIELRQCLQAIVTASPELLSGLTQGDFTIYAHDYSEYDTPLVGQGMLSAALMVEEGTKQNNVMITGRVCKNMLALFSNGVKETLEVKLRLVPVSRPISNDYAKGMTPFGGVTTPMSSGFDPNSWNATANQPRPHQPGSDYFNLDSLIANDGKGIAMDHGAFMFGPEGSGNLGEPQIRAAGMGIAETPSGGNFGMDPAFAAHSYSAPGSRAGSPMMSLEPSSRTGALRHQSFSGDSGNHIVDPSRPESRASVRSVGRPSNHQRQASAPSPSRQFTVQEQQQTSDVYYNEDDQPRKRAKVIQADWHGRSSFGTKSSDLRVTAATAASMHMHRPIPKRSMAPGSNLEPPPRVPTPIPGMSSGKLPQQQYQQNATRGSLLRQASIASFDYMSDTEAFSDAIVSSPEDESPSNSITAEGTPQDIPSSPPVFPDANVPQPSSPGLPFFGTSQLPDSGYMSERGLTSSNAVESVEHDGIRGRDILYSDIAGQYHPPKGRNEHTNSRKVASSRQTPAFTSDININLETPGDMNQLPQKMLLNVPQNRREGSQGAYVTKKTTVNERAATSSNSAAIAQHQMSAAGQSSVHPSIGSSQSREPVLAKSLSTGDFSANAFSNTIQPRRGSLALPPTQSFPTSDLPDVDSNVIQSRGSAPPRKPSIRRSRTSSNDSEAGSPAPSDTEGRPRGPNRSGSGAQRRKLIEQKLQKSIQNGEMPTFCSHCGAIETPTWRRLYVQHVDGKPSPLDYQEGEGETIGIEAVEVDDMGETTRFVIRKAMKKTKDTQPGVGFEEVVVCNPCGLWFNKFRNMRPSDKWGRKVGSRRSKKSRENEGDLMTDGLEPQSDMLFTDQLGPEDVVEDVKASRAVSTERANTRSRSPRARTHSTQPQAFQGSNPQSFWGSAQANDPQDQAVQLSPTPKQSTDKSPIDVDEYATKPTRRLLFPSPRREGEIKSLDDNLQAIDNDTTPSKQGALKKLAFSPKGELDFGYPNSQIFDAFTSLNKENMEPSIDVYSIDNLDQFISNSPSAFRTPRKSSSKAIVTPRSTREPRSLQQTPTSASRKRKPLTPSFNAANGADVLHAHDFMTSPSANRYFLRSTPSRLERTPGRTPGRNSDISNNQEMTPWSRQLAQILSGSNDADAFTSPSRQFDFTGLPTFATPGRTLDDCDWQGLEEIMSSEFATFGDQDSGSAAAQQSTQPQ